MRTAAVVAVGLAIGLATAATTPTWATTRQTLADPRPPWATAGADTGPIPPGTNVTARVYLAGRDPAALAAYAQAVTQPTSPTYQHYLTPARFRSRFGPSPTQTTAITGWLTATGLRITATTPHYLTVTGTATQVQQAFGTQLHTYRTTTGPRQAPQSPVTVPSSIAPAILTITGLTTPPRTLDQDTAAPAPVDVGSCSTYYGEKPATDLPAAYGATADYDVCGYTPDQLRAAYGVTGSGLTGRGVTVAVVDAAASPTIAQDVNTYSAQHDLPTWRPTQNLPADIATSCASTTTYGEESMDVDAVHAMAPDANIVYVGADCTNLGNDLLDAETRIVDARLADIVSDSWHLGTTEDQVPPELIPAYGQVFQQGAVEGIGFYFAAGDHGDWSQDSANHRAAVQYPGSDPWVTSVGGTSLAIGPNARYEWELPWGDDLAPLSSDGKTWTDPPGSFVFGTGGGPSATFAQPRYQRGIVPAKLSGPVGSPARVVPDIAADADLATGMVYGHTTTLTDGGVPRYAEFRGDGTSQATPLIAGLQADAQQARHGIPIGFANPSIYARYDTSALRDITANPTGQPNAVAVVDEERDPSTGDITIGLGTLAHDTSLSAGPGYDDTTGVGTPSQQYIDSYR